MTHAREASKSVCASFHRLSKTFMVPSELRSQFQPAYVQNGANHHRAKAKVAKGPQPFFFALFSGIITFQGVNAPEHDRRSNI